MSQACCSFRPATLWKVTRDGEIVWRRNHFAGWERRDRSIAGHPAGGLTRIDCDWESGDVVVAGVVSRPLRTDREEDQPAMWTVRRYDTEGGLLWSWSSEPDGVIDPQNNRASPLIPRNVFVDGHAGAWMLTTVPANDRFDTAGSWPLGVRSLDRRTSTVMYRINERGLTQRVSQPRAINPDQRNGIGDTVGAFAYVSAHRQQRNLLAVLDLQNYVTNSLFERTLNPLGPDAFGGTTTTLGLWSPYVICQHTPTIVMTRGLGYNTEPIEGEIYSYTLIEIISNRSQNVYFDSRWLEFEVEGNQISLEGTSFAHLVANDRYLLATAPNGRRALIRLLEHSGTWASWYEVPANNTSALIDDEVVPLDNDGLGWSLAGGMYDAKTGERIWTPRPVGGAINARAHDADGNTYFATDLCELVIQFRT